MIILDNKAKLFVVVIRSSKRHQLPKVNIGNSWNNVGQPCWIIKHVDNCTTSLTFNKGHLIATN